MPLDKNDSNLESTPFSADTALEVQLKSVDQLSEADWRLGEEFRTQAVGLDSPFLAPEFAQAASPVFPSTQVAALTSGSTTVGFWPFDATDRSGCALAATVNELSDGVASDQLHFNPSQLLPSLGLKRWKVDSVPESQKGFKALLAHRQESFFLSLLGGFQEYQQNLKSTGSRQWSDNARNVRKLEREHKSLQWNWHDSDPQLLEQLFRWKREQYLRTNQIDVLGIPAVQRLARNIHHYSQKSSPVYCHPFRWRVIR